MRVLRKNIVVLVYGENEGHVRVVGLGEVLDSEELTVDIRGRDGFWTYRGETHQIGEHRSCGVLSERRGVIGVYDRSRNEQLNSMLYAMCEATSHSPCLADG